MKRVTAVALLLCCCRAARSKGASRPPDPYKVLNVPKTANDKDIKTAYKAAALKLHPDKAPASQRKSAEAKFKKANAAYQQIRDSSARQKHARESRGAQRSPFAPRYAPPAQELRVPLRVSVEDLLRGATRYAVITSGGFTFLLPVKIDIGMRPGDVVDRKAHDDTILNVVLETKPDTVYRIDGEDLHTIAYLQKWASPYSLRMRAPGAHRLVPVRLLRKRDVVSLKRGAKEWRDGFRLRKKGRGLYARDGLERGDLVVTLRRRSVRGSIAVLAARLSPLLALMSAVQNRTRTLRAAGRARDLARKHAPSVLGALTAGLRARRVFDDLARYSGAPAEGARW
jgi:curved DNA-binding protein CbpA